MDMSDELHAPAALSPGKNLATHWTIETVWTFWRRQKSLAPAGIQNPDGPVRSLDTIRVRSRVRKFRPDIQKPRQMENAVRDI